MCESGSFSVIYILYSDLKFSHCVFVVLNHSEILQLSWL